MLGTIDTATDTATDTQTDTATFIPFVETKMHLLATLHNRFTLLVFISLLAATLPAASRPQPLLAQTTEPVATAQESVVVLAAGDIAKCNLEWDAATGALLDALPGPILGLGDNAQYIGSLQEFYECYDPVWGRHKDRIYPVPGNHEYLTGGAEGYFTYFGDRATPLEPGCKKECKGYYSFDVGAWHIVALNSEINNDPGSEQDLWLRADLAAHPNVCTLAYWHKPRWTSGYHRSGASAPLFQAVYDYGVDIVLSGHDHDYERFAPQSPQGVPEPERGVRQFVVGTGGADHRGWKTDQANSEARDADTWGVLKLTLHPTSYDWEFIPIAGQTFTDSGSGNCVVAGSVPAAPIAQTSTVSTDLSPVAVADDPAAMAAAAMADAAQESAATAVLPAAGLDYVVQAGDTLSLIALRYGLDWEVVAQVNGITNTEVIEVGQVIRLPGVDEADAVNLLPAPTPAAAAPVGSTGTGTGTGAVGGVTYTVTEGDTLFGIALLANISLQELLTANNLQEDDFLQIGQVLTIPGRTTALRQIGALTAAATLTTTAAATRTLTAATPVTATVTATAVTATAGVTRSVTTGSTGSITGTRPLTATTPSLLAAATPTPRPIVAVSNPAVGAAASGPSVHTVAEGETIITIALQYDLDWQELLALNGMGPDSILQVGQEIRLR